MKIAPKGPEAAQIRRRKYQLIRRYQIPEDILPGSLSLHRTRCGKPNCRCAQGEGRPVCLLTDMAGGRKYVQHIPKRMVDAASGRRCPLSGAEEHWWTSRTARRFAGRWRDTDVCRRHRRAGLCLRRGFPSPATVPGSTEAPVPSVRRVAPDRGHHRGISLRHDPSEGDAQALKRGPGVEFCQGAACLARYRHPERDGSACGRAARMPSVHSPMILTSTRFVRRPSNSP